MGPGDERDERESRTTQLQKDVPLEPWHRHREQEFVDGPAELPHDPQHRPRGDRRPEDRHTTTPLAPARADRVERRQRWEQEGDVAGHQPRRLMIGELRHQRRACAGVDKPCDSPVHGRQRSAVSICARCNFPLKSTYTDFHSEKTSSAAVPASRCPFPVDFVPPNGRWTSAPMVGALT